jgi:hypothetical protein
MHLPSEVFNQRHLVHQEMCSSLAGCRSHQQHKNLRHWNMGEAL